MAAITQPPNTANDWQLVTHSPAWNRLSDAQKIWVGAFVALNGDAKAATRRAYPKAKKSSIPGMAWQQLQSPRVQDVLNLYRGRGEREKLIELVRDQISHAEAGSTAAQKLIAQLERLTLGSYSEHDAPATSEPDAVPAPSGPGDRPRYAVGDIVEQGGHRFRIEAVELADVEVDK